MRLSGGRGSFTLVTSPGSRATADGDRSLVAPEYLGQLAGRIWISDGQDDLAAVGLFDPGHHRNLAVRPGQCTLGDGVLVRRIEEDVEQFIDRNRIAHPCCELVLFVAAREGQQITAL